MGPGSAVGSGSRSVKDGWAQGLTRAGIGLICEASSRRRVGIYQHPLFKFAECPSRTISGQACLSSLVQAGQKKYINGAIEEVHKARQV